MNNYEESYNKTLKISAGSSYMSINISDVPENYMPEISYVNILYNNATPEYKVAII